MGQRNISPTQLSFYIILMLTIILIPVLLISYFSVSTSLYFVLIILSLIGFLIGGFFIIKNAIEKFIYRKIKLIYKSIHQFKLKSQSEELKKKVVRSKDVISEVNDEVLIWARGKKEEIEELKQLEEYRKEFIGNLSHELKTPIFNIQGYLSTLIDGGIEDQEIATKYIQNAERNVERMISLVEDLDTIYKLESGKVQLDMEKFDVVHLAKEVMDLNEMKAKARNVSLQLKEDYRTPIWVFADKNTIRQVFTNLIVNSIVYGNDGGHTKISFYDMDEYILCEVSDDGPGIDEKHIPRLFERFYRVDKSRSRHQGGTGLGLSIVKHIIEAHHQTINVRSSTDKGSTFSFTLKKFKA
jgi:two-component system phosphate regulon sensor histidine kinase PhoR